MVFALQNASVWDILRILLTLNTSKGAGSDTLPPKIINLAAPIIAHPLTKIIYLLNENSVYPDLLKIASVVPALKKGEHLDKENYRPISILNTFSKVFERYILKQLAPFFDKTMSQFLSAYRKSYSCQSVLLWLIEQWKSYLDNNKVVGAVLMDLSKAFYSLPHDLLLAKLEAYGFERKTLKFIYSHLTNRKQAVKIKGFVGILEQIISGVPQGSILCPVLFNIFMNDRLYFIDSEHLHNFADDNTLSDHADCIDELVNNLERSSAKAIEWMFNNQMIANPSKIHAIILTKNTKDMVRATLNIKQNLIENETEVDLLGLHIVQRLSFSSHIKKLCKKAANNLMH